MLMDNTGYKESDGKLIYDIDWNFIKDIAIRMSENKSKYPKGNWKKPMELESIEEAMERHFIEYKRGNTDENHLIAIVCNAMIINYHKNGCNTNL